MKKFHLYVHDHDRAAKSCNFCRDDIIPQLGYLDKSITAYGYFGDKTLTAVNKYKDDKKLWNIGIYNVVVGDTTWNALKGDIAKMPAKRETPLEAFLRIANQELNTGFKEHDGDNITKYGAWADCQGQPWCAAFVSWCASKAGILKSVVPFFVSVPVGIDWYKNESKFKSGHIGYTPKAGDLIFFDGHVGIVAAYDPNVKKVYTIEGNSDNAIKQNHYTISDTYIVGYGCNGGISNGTIPSSSTSGTGKSTK